MVAYQAGLLQQLGPPALGPPPGGSGGERGAVSRRALRPAERAGLLGPAQPSMTQHDAAWPSGQALARSARPSVAQHGSARLSTAQHGSAWLSTAQRGPAWLSTAQHNQPSSPALLSSQCRPQAPASAAELSDPPTPEDVALFLHTSGTTSRPKGVPLTQGNLVASIQNIVDVSVGGFLPLFG